MELYVFSLFDCSLSCNRETVILKYGELVKIEPNEPFYALFLVSPISENEMDIFIPYSFELKYSMGRFEPFNHKYCKMIEYDKKQIIFLNSKKVGGKQNQVFLNFNDKNCHIYQDSFFGKLIISANNNIVYSSEIPFFAEKINAIAEKFGDDNYLFIELFGQGKAYLIITSQLDKPIFSGEITTYQIEPNEILILKDFNDELEQSHITQFELKGGKLVLKEEFTSVKRAAHITLKKILPFVFLECIIAKNYTRAAKFLTHDLNEKVGVGHLENYFPEFNSILNFPLKENTVVLIKNGVQVGICHFDIVNNQINNLMLDDV